jgi:hypothetical protein
MLGRQRPTAKPTLKTLLALSAALAGLGVGAYRVYADDERGEPPEVAAPSITAKPAKLTRHRWARFRFTDPERGVTFRCALDRSRQTACRSPKLSGPLSRGRHTFWVKAVHWVGEVELSAPVSYTWWIDRRPRTPRIARHPLSPTLSTTATFLVTDRQRHVRLRCRLDRDHWSPCRHRMTYRRLRVGRHDWRVRAIDRLGLPSRAARFRWRIRPKDRNVTLSSGVHAPAGLLYPGAAPEPIPVTLSNPHRAAIYVTRLVAVVTGGSANCDSATNISLAQSSASSAKPIEVPAHGSVTLPAQGISAPTIALVNLPVNQDACMNEAFPVHVTMSAHS